MAMCRRENVAKDRKTAYLVKVHLPYFTEHLSLVESDAWSSRTRISESVEFRENPWKSLSISVCFSLDFVDISVQKNVKHKKMLKKIVHTNLKLPERSRITRMVFLIVKMIFYDK